MLEFKICTFHTDGNVFTSNVTLVMNKLCYKGCSQGYEPWYNMQCASRLKLINIRTCLHKAEDSKLLPYNLVCAEQS